ncbi:protein kinase [Coemansia sp. RSA 1722]|nr:protein kinase [Coemansia sp. RSA 486]KAJ2232035.1 protein kinase [Coemansia sp. RSA 485]KAJ2601710.1 protein kinase [Coemansia sp. RSA 1721]KAJ2605771.1 protein kinase [Coemansia sp. RSA 1722]KAJ2639204.1 protein kinase [Coemansia sp. RSA 1286]
MDSGEVRMAGSLQAKNAQFQAEIAAMDPMETEDPLDVYFRYICWLFEVFPQATGHQAVIKLVEKPLMLFREQERYRNDSRYVKMWIWYTGLINEGKESVFQFLLSNNIGDSLAVLYEEYAKLLESRGKGRRADEVYQLGVARKAQPLVRLERRYNEFQRRIMAQTIRDVDAGQIASNGGHQSATSSSLEIPNGVDENHGRGRSMLGNKRSGGSVRSAAANMLPQAQRGLPSQRDRGDSVSGRANARISVFADPEGVAAAPVAGQQPGNTEPMHSGWREIGSDEARRKENMPEAASWRGQTFEQRRVGAPSAISGSAPYMPAIEKFTVFSDDSRSDWSSGDMRSFAEQSSGVLAPRGPAHSSVSGASSSGLLRSFDAVPQTERRQHKEKAKERMVIPDRLLFPHGDGVPQCVEEARARLSRYAFDYDAWARREEEEKRVRSAQRQKQQQMHQIQPPSTVSKLRTAVRLNDEDDDDDGIADESGFARNKRKSMGISSPTINTREAQKGMLGIWNDISDSDSDSESLRGAASRRPGARPDGRPGASTAMASASSAPSAVDDDYQFTMGPVTPHVVPHEISNKPAMIPSSARSGSRFQAFLDRSGSQTQESQSQETEHAVDENDAPTVVLNSIRAKRRQELRFARAKPTPLAARVQTPLQSHSLVGRGLRDINEESEGDEEDQDDEHQLLHANGALKTPMGERIQIFRDSPAGSSAVAVSRGSRPEPLFAHQTSSEPAPLGRKFEVMRDQPLSAPVMRPGSFATPGRGTVGSSGGPVSVTKSASASVLGHIGQTPGYTRTATGYSISGAEFSALSGFTGLSTIGGPSMLAHEHLESDNNNNNDDYHTETSDISHTPMRKRLSMAAKDLCKITPRFPKQMVDGVDGQFSNHGTASSYQDVDDDDDDDDEYEDAEDGDEEPCTENIGEFADLDSQMNELQMQLGKQFARQSGDNNTLRNTPKRGGPLFEIFRD